MTFFLEVIDELHGTPLAVFFGLESRIGTGVFEHGQIVHGNVGAAPCVGSGRQIVGVGFARHFEHSDCDALGDFGTAGEPLGIGPRLHDFFGLGVAGFGFFGYVVEGIEHQKGFLQAFGSHTRDFGVVEQVDERFNVVASHHGAQQFCGLGFGDECDLDIAMGHCCQERSLHFCSIVYTWRHAVSQQLHELLLATCRRGFDQFNDRFDLFGVKRQRRNAQCGTLCNVGFVGLKKIRHGHLR